MRGPHRNEMKTPKQQLCLRIYIPFLTKSYRLWKLDKGKGVCASSGNKLRKDKYMGELMEGKRCFSKICLWGSLLVLTLSPVIRMFSFLVQREHFITGNLWPAFRWKEGGQRALPAPAISQTLSTQNNQWDKVAYSDSFSEECLQASPTLLHPKSLSSRTGSLTLSK